MKYYYNLMYILAAIIIDANGAADLHIRMISEGSCDTEDWSNDVENSVNIIISQQIQSILSIQFYIIL